MDYPDKYQDLSNVKKVKVWGRGHLGRLGRGGEDEGGKWLEDHWVVDMRFGKRELKCNR